MNKTYDLFLNGKLKIIQPSDGYRAATDPVFLAASIQANSGQTVLDIGSGVGVASLCLGARIKGLSLNGAAAAATSATNDSFGKQDHHK